MSVGKLWQDIVKVALVGSDRQSLSLPVESGTLVEMLGQVPTDPPEGHLLRVAGTVALYRQAGQRPTPLDLTAPEPCETEDLPLCSPLARRLLGILLAGEHRELLPEWLERAAAAGQRVPAERLPQVLARGKKDAALRPLVVLVLGKRGQWLAACNPHWDYATAAAGEVVDPEVWQTGSPEARLAFLRQVRRQDPDRARELVASTWKSEKANGRVAQLEILATNLTMADEPWLETVLDDRSKNVRQASAALLATLPESRLCQRMAARVAPLLEWKDGRQPAIAVTLPSKCDAAMERDAIAPKPERGLGEKAWWLLQMLEAIPPAYWCQHWQTTPQALIRSVEERWQGILWAGWATAAINYGATDWAEALLQPEFVKSFPELAPPLLASLPPERQQVICLQMLQAAPAQLSAADSRGTLVTGLLESCQGPWSLELTEATITHLLAAVTQKKTPAWSYGLVGFLPTLALRAPVSSPAETAQIVAKVTAALEDDRSQYYFAYYLQPFQTRLEVRQQIQQAFSATPATP